MTNSNNEMHEVEGLMLDVRKSYRFLYEYQRRVMDLISFIAGYWGFVYDKGEPLFCKPPSHKKINPSINWAWDFLLFYNYCFVYAPQDFGIWKGVRLMINIVSDTGFYDVDTTDRLDVLHFGRSEEAKTQLHLVLKTSGIDWEDYKNSHYSSQHQEHYVKIGEGQSSITIGYKFDLSKLRDEANVHQCLKRFEKLCASHELILKKEDEESAEQEMRT